VKGEASSKIGWLPPRVLEFVGKEGDSLVDSDKAISAITSHDAMPDEDPLVQDCCHCRCCCQRRCRPAHTSIGQSKRMKELSETRWTMILTLVGQANQRIT